MTPIGLDKFKKDSVVCEVPPVVDDKGEFTEVQVLEEGEVFDPDEFLDQLEKHQPPKCPRHMVPLKFRSVTCPDGSTFKYYRCPSKRFYTKCYVTCGADEVHTYLKRVRAQTHPC